ncbi:hypothetical protein [Kitasatospora sp. NPDC088134]|uniref:hypothetical protein n=1 Tax=Kitasatospora sp. NPDC088134 TaxID=3364071 RepID=UPI00381ECECD
MASVFLVMAVALAGAAPAQADVIWTGTKPGPAQAAPAAPSLVKLQNLSSDVIWT